MSHLFRVAAREWRRSLAGGSTQSAASRARVFASSADGSSGGASATVEAARRTAIPPDGPGLRDTARPGERGLLVTPRDVAALAEAIANLAGDSALRTRLGNGARRLAESTFSSDAVIRQTAALYRDLLKTT